MELTVTDIIGKSIKIWLLAAAVIVGISGPVAAMDRTTMLTMFFGNSRTAILWDDTATWDDTDTWSEYL